MPALPTDHAIDAMPTTAGLSPATAPGPILVATDGGGAALSAMRVARQVAGETRDVQVIGVVEPTPIIMPPSPVPMFSTEAEEARVSALSYLLREQVATVFGADEKPKLTVSVGPTVELLSEIARERNADLIVMGLRHHGRLDRMFMHRETPLSVARVSRVPVLTVPEGATGLPRIVLFAVDVDDASVNAARRARLLLAAAEKVYLVHVRSGLATGLGAAGWERLYGEVTQATFDRVTAALELPAGMLAERHVLTGHPVDELLDFAEYARVELIVSGFHRRTLADRVTGVRSVAERTFRGVTCQMLLVPDVTGTEQSLGRHAETEVYAHADAWGAQLSAFATRNTGRVAHVEVDTLEIGAQAQLRGYALVGAEYDAAAGCIRLMLGGAAAGVPHLTHVIPRPRSVELLRRRDGQDEAMRVTHEGGQTLLTFRGA